MLSVDWTIEQGHNLPRGRINFGRTRWMWHRGSNPPPAIQNLNLRSSIRLGVSLFSYVIYTLLSSLAFEQRQEIKIRTTN